MKNTISKAILLPALLATVFYAGAEATPAQFNVKLPNIKIKKPEVKIENPDIGKTKIPDTNTNVEVKVKKGDSKIIYAPQRPTDVPMFLKNSVYVQAQTIDEYWKMKGQRNFSSWVPMIRFKHFYNQSKSLNYTVEYFNPDGSPWYSEKLEESGSSADRIVSYQSPSSFGNGVLDTKCTNATGVYSFKITNQDTKELLFQGKFKVGKINSSYEGQEKNKFDFFVEHDWLLPYAMIGFHHSLDEVGATPPEMSVWLKGAIEEKELEGRIFYKGQQVASTKEAGGASGDEDRNTDYTAGLAPNKAWKRWQFTWRNFLFDNNGTFNRENFPNAFYADKNPGDYTVKIYHKGKQVREFSFAIGADGRFVVPTYMKEVFLPYHRILLPVKNTDPTEKWDAASWKTEAFYGNPINGFTLQ